VVFAGTKPAKNYIRLVFNNHSLFNRFPDFWNVCDLINSGGDQTAPFFTYGYITLSTVLGNLICMGLASLSKREEKAT
jgi:hypothetical protein